MSMSWKSCLFAFFVIAIVDQINTAPPDNLDDIKIKSSIGSKYGFAAGNDPTGETTTTEGPTTPTPTDGPTPTPTEGPTPTPTEGPTPAPSNEFTQFTLQSTGSKRYKVKEAALEHGKWWLSLISDEVSEFAVNSLTFGNTPLVFGGVKRLGSNDGVKGRFKIKSMEGLVALVVDFEVKGKEPPKITLSEGTSCYGRMFEGIPNIYYIRCD